MEPEVREVLEAIVLALSGDRDRLGRIAGTADNMLRKEPLRKLAQRYKVGGSLDLLDQISKVAQATLKAHETRCERCGEEAERHREDGTCPTNREVEAS